MSRVALSAVVSLLALLTASAEAAGQRAPAAVLGAGFVVGIPLGDFDRFVSAGYGGEIEARFSVGRSGAAALRVHGGYVEYARQREGVCLTGPVGCRIELGLRTSSGIGFAGAGPEIALPGALSPYLNASGGVAYFATHSALTDDVGGSFGTTIHHDDLVPALRMGGGFRLRLNGARFPVALDVGGQYHRHGTVEYLRPRDVSTRPDGTLVLHPIRGEADLVTYRVGLSVGLGGGDERRGGGGRPRHR